MDWWLVFTMELIFKFINYFLFCILLLPENGRIINEYDLLQIWMILIAWVISLCHFFQVLIDAGADVNVQNQWGHTPLMEAVCYNNKDASQKILSASCDVNLREYKSGDTALHVAVRKSYTVIVDQVNSQCRLVDNYQLCNNANINNNAITITGI